MMEELHRRIYRREKNLDAAIKAWDFEWKIDSRDLVRLSENSILVADAKRGIELWKKASGKWRYTRTLAGGIEAYRLLKRGKLLYAFVREERKGRFIIRYRIAEKVDSFLEKLLEKHPEYCTEISTMEELHRRIYRREKNLDAAIKAWDFEWKIDSRDLVRLSENEILVADAKRGIELWKLEAGRWRYMRTLAGGIEAYRLLKRGKLLYAFVREERKGRFIIRYRIDPRKAALTEESRMKSRSFSDWDATKNGELLFLADRYGGVTLADFRDLRHPDRRKALGVGRDNYTNDLLWDAARTRLYAATRRGLLTCTLDAKALRCENNLLDYPYGPDRTHRCRLRDGGVHCEDPVPPRSLLGVVQLTKNKLLGIKSHDKGKRTLLALFDTENAMGIKPTILENRVIDLTMKGANYLSASHPQNALKAGPHLYLPTKDSLAVIDENLTLEGCLPSGRIYRLLPLAPDRLLAAQGKKGIRLLTIQEPRLSACDKMQKNSVTKDR